MLALFLDETGFLFSPRDIQIFRSEGAGFRVGRSDSEIRRYWNSVMDSEILDCQIKQVNLVSISERKEERYY